MFKIFQEINENSQLNFVSDNPLETKEEDKLDRFNFIQQLGNRILEYDNVDSLVIGLYGEWGSGKSSIINLTIEYLENSPKNGIKILKFNPWNFSKQNQLILEFFNELETLFGSKGIEQKIKKNIKKYKDILINNTKISLGFSDNLFKGENHIMLTTDLSKENENYDSTLNYTKNMINAQLKEISEFKILVIIDNIDRLNDKEIQQMFQLVNSLADFPNMIYLLAFDKKVVMNSLDKIQKNYSEHYLEKIIQVPIEIPMIRKYELNKLLETDINKILCPKFCKEEWESVLINFEYYITNIREIKRYCNQLNFFIDVIGNDIYIKDFLIINLLKIYEPQIYEEIKNNRKKYIFNNDFLTCNYDEEGEYDKSILKKIFKKRKKETPKNIIEKLILELFPFNDYLTWYVFNTDQKNWNAICYEESFDKYFAFNLNYNDISDKEIEDILKENNISNFNENILNINKNKPEVIPRLLEKLQHYSKKINITSIPIIINSLMDIGDMLYESEKSFKTNLKHGILVKIFNNLLLQINDENIRYNILKRSITLSQNSIYTYISYIEEINWCYENIAKSNELIISINHLEELKILCSEKLISINPQYLTECKYFGYILKEWEPIANEEFKKKIMENLKEKCAYLMKFIKIFAYPKSREYREYTNVKEIFTGWTFNIREVKKFIDLDEINLLIENCTDDKLKDEYERMFRFLFLEDLIGYQEEHYYD